MSDRVLRPFAALALAAAFILGPTMASAQSGDPKAGENARKQSEPNAKEGKKAEDLDAISKEINGPAGNPECIWLGRRVVNLLWRDDLDTAFRHLDLYDRFGCPGGHIQATFRCVVRQGNIDPKAPESLSARVQTCWVNPDVQPAPAPAATQNPAPGGTPAQ